MAQNPTGIASVKADRISYVPCDVMDNILKRLSLHDAVRTSILSRKWRYKWTTIPYLVIDVDLRRSTRRYEFKPIINHVLAIYKGPLVKFELIVAFIRDVSTIDHWLHFLSNHPIEDMKLEVQLETKYSVIKKPVLHHLFGFVHLRYLCLWRIEVRVTPVFEGFNRLLKLSLSYVDFGPEDSFDMFISKCPMLEHLYVFRCNTPLSILIDAPNLKSFEFDGRFKSVIFKNVNIEDISVMGDDDGLCPHPMPRPESLGNESNLLTVFGQMSSLRRLAADHHFLRFLAVGGVPRKLQNDFKHLTSLELSAFDFTSLNQVTCALCLIRSCPSLQTLTFECITIKEDYFREHVIEHLRAEQTLEIPLSCSLKNAKMTIFEGLKEQMEFVKLLLLGAVVLRELKLECFGPPGCEMREELGFPRASPEAVIIVAPDQGV